MLTPKISVVMPAYNAERFLDESIRSILDQTFKDFEFVIVNDGSTDNTPSIIKKYKKKDKRIKQINNAKNLGLQKTLNRGLKATKGKYIARMDADDISLPERLETQYRYLENHKDIFLVGSSAIVVDEYGKRLGIFEKYDDYKKTRRKLLKNNTMIHPSIMFRNEGISYREKFRTSEDYDLYLRILSSGKNIINLPNLLIKYRIRKNSFVSTMKNQDFFYKKAKEFYWQRLKQGKDGYSRLKTPAGKKIQQPDSRKLNITTKILAEFQDNKMRKARKDIRKFVKDYGVDKRMTIFYILTFIPYGLTRFIKNKFLL